MSSPASSYYFRRRTIGRAASPPTWACYEQISYDDDGYSDSGSESCSEDDEDYSHNAASNEPASDSENGEHVVDVSHGHSHGNDAHDVDNMDMDIDHNISEPASKTDLASVKGKQRAIDPEPESNRRRHTKTRQRIRTLRPILTIHRSQGFVWNQDLFIPPYIKDRYVASTSPPNSTGFLSTSASSTNSGFGDYEVEVVEIRVQDGELDHIIP